LRCVDAGTSQGVAGAKFRLVNPIAPAVDGSYRLPRGPNWFEAEAEGYLTRRDVVDVKQADAVKRQPYANNGSAARGSAPLVRDSSRATVPPFASVSGHAHRCPPSSPRRLRLLFHLLRHDGEVRLPEARPLVGVRGDEPHRVFWTKCSS
jgi:hypothetical protein